MCRLAAFPPNFPREEAISILRHFYEGNPDGVGSAYVKNEEFVVNKYPYSLHTALRRNQDEFLSHMPYRGWTIAHLRAASHGQNFHKNTHPFIAGNWAVIHNGIWSDYNIAKLALRKFVKFEGETDSEVAAHMIRFLGPPKFAKEIEHGGVFLALHRNGGLHVMKTSGDLSYSEYRGDKVLLASELSPRRYDAQEALVGWCYFDKHGRYIRSQKKEFEYFPQTNHYRAPSVISRNQTSYQNHVWYGGH